MSVTISTVNVGTTANDGTGDDIRSAFVKVNYSMANLKSGVDGLTTTTANTTLARVANLQVTSQVIGNLTLSGNLLPSANVGSNIGSATAWFNSIYAVTSSSYHADLAENYQADTLYAPGTVVIFGGDAEITTTDVMADVSVAGVVSAQPAYLMNAAQTGTPVALRGRVPVLVVGPVTKGDLLVTSTTPGHACSVGRLSTYGVAVFAKSLTTDSRAGERTIEAVIL